MGRTDKQYREWIAEQEAIISDLIEEGKSWSEVKEESGAPDEVLERIFKLKEREMKKNRNVAKGIDYV